jgi:putative DNA primase/helicase
LRGPKSGIDYNMLLKTVHHFLSDLGYNTDRLPAHLSPGKPYRIPSIGKKSTNTAMAVTLRNDGTYLYKDHATGDGGAFNPEWGKSKVLTPEDIENRRRRKEWVKQQEQQEQLRKQKSFASKKIEAQQIWDRSTPCDEHPYLQGNPKTAWIKPIGARTLPYVRTGTHHLKNPLVIPRYDIETNELVNLEFITVGQDKPKLPVSGAQSGNYHFVIDGKLPSAFCEGYKTGLAFHHATGHRVVVCFNADMLKDVFKKLAKSDDFIIADNDNALDRNDDFTQKVLISELIIKGRGTGHKAAIEAGSKFYMPFKPGTDFADLTKDEIQAVFERPPISSIPVYTVDQLPPLDKEKPGSYYLNMMSTEEDPFQCAYAARAFSEKSISSIPYQMSEWDLREAIERATNGNIHPTTLDNIIGDVRGKIAKARNEALKHLVVGKEALVKHRVQNIDRLDQISFINRNRIPARALFTKVSPDNAVRAPFMVAPYYKGVYIVQAPTGSGKTQKIGLPFRKWCYSNRHTFLSVAHLRSLIREMSERLKTDHYEDEKLAVKQALKHGRFDQWNSSEDALSICLPSIDYEHFQNFVRRTKYVFIDEISQVLEAFTTDDMFHHTDTKLIYDRLSQIVARAECLIVADANINERTLEFIERCRPNEKFNFIQINPKNEGKTAFIHDTEAALFRHVLNRVMVDDHNVWITCDTASKVEELAKAFSHYDHINCLAITGPNQKKTEQTAFLNNPSEESKKYNIVIASSVISSGISIEHDHFDFVAGFFNGSTIKPTDAYQMIGRVRRCKEFRLFVSQKYLVSVRAERDLQGRQQASVLEDGKAAEITEFSKMRVSLVEARSKAISDFANSLIYVLEQKCFEIKRCNVLLEEYESVIDHQANLKLIKEELSEEHQEALKAACQITDKMAEDMKVRSYLDEQEMIELEAWHIKKSLGYPCDHVLTDRDLSVSPSKVIRFSAALGRYKASQDKQKDLMSRNYRKALTKIYSVVFDGVEFAPGAIFYKQCAQEIIDRVYKYRFLLVSIGAIPRYFGAENYKPSKTPAKELNDILKHMGLKAKYIRNSAKRVEMALYLYSKNRSSLHLSDESHCYQIESESMDLMREYSDMKFNYEAARESDNTVKQFELDVINKLELDHLVPKIKKGSLRLQQVEVIRPSANDGPDDGIFHMVYRIANE